MKTLIVGYGNTLRGDDGFGVRVIEELAKHITNPDVELISCHQLLPELAESVAAVDLALFIDADVSSPPGQINCRQVEPVPSTITGVTHSFDVATLLAFARAVYGSSPKAYLYSVGASSFEIGEQLTPIMEKAVDEVVDKILFDIMG